MRQLFIDLDGVLADFDGHFEKCFGVRPNQDTYEPPGMWDKIRAHGNFYRELPLMPDAYDLWGGVGAILFHSGPDYLQPIILTGIPHSIPDVAQQKREWVADKFGKYQKVITCFSRDKHKHGRPGDVLVDDRLKYSHYWLQMGGIFVHHKSAHQTLQELAALW